MVLSKKLSFPLSPEALPRKTCDQTRAGLNPGNKTVLSNKAEKLWAKLIQKKLRIFTSKRTRLAKLEDEIQKELPSVGVQDWSDQTDLLLSSKGAPDDAPMDTLRGPLWRARLSRSTCLSQRNRRDRCRRQAAAGLRSNNRRQLSETDTRPERLRRSTPTRQSDFSSKATARTQKEPRKKIDDLGRPEIMGGV